MQTEIKSAPKKGQCTIIYREKTRVLLDPRCYDGCYFKSKLVWTDWKVIETIREEKAKERVEFWRELNKFAVSQRGEAAVKEYRILNSKGEIKDV